MRLTLFVLTGLLAAGGISAQMTRDGPSAPTRPRAQTSVAAKHKANSFAPRPGNKRHVYGEPIQRPILKSAKPRQPAPKP